jgi:hypothetical protein
MKGAIAKLVPALFPLLAASALGTESLLYSQNSLLNNGHWIVGKRMIQGCPQHEALLTRLPLAGNQLDLGAWDRHQEVIFRAGGKPVRALIRFTLENNSYLDFTFNRQGGYSGLRLSRLPFLPSFAFQSDAGGKFLWKESMPALAPSDGWHELELRQQGGELLARLDQGLPMRVPSLRMDNGQIGLRGGFGSARVASLDLELSDGHIFRENFRNSAGWLRVFWLNLAIFTFFTLGFSAVSLLGSVFDSGLFFARWQKAAFASALFFLLWFSFDFTFWSRQPHRFFAQAGSAEYDPPGERFRYALFAAWSRLAGLRTASAEEAEREGYPTRIFGDQPAYCGPPGGECRTLSRQAFEALGAKKKNDLRILLLGGSGTAGCGASKLENSAFARLYRSLQAATGLGQPVELLNAATYSSVAAFQDYRKSQYLDSLERFSADLVIVQRLVLQDSAEEMDSLASSLERVSRERRIPVVLVLAEYDPEALLFQWDGFKETNASLQSVALKHHLTVFDPQEAFGRESIAAGAQWWDVLHPNDFGHKQLASWLAPKILATLSPASKRAAP